MQANYLNLLGLAYRAQACVIGVEQILHQIRTQRAKLVLIAKDCGTHTFKKLTDKCMTYDVPYQMVDEKEVISYAIGQNNRVAIAIVNDGFAKKLQTLIEGK